MERGKAPGGCGFYDETLKAGGAAALLWLHTLLCSIWKKVIITTDWGLGVVVSMWKGKGDTQECNNYMGLPFSVTGLVLTQFFLDRVFKSRPCGDQLGRGRAFLKYLFYECIHVYRLLCAVFLSI